MIVAPSFRVDGSRGQSQATMICCSFLLTEVGLPFLAPGLCCKGLTVWLLPLPFSQRMWDRVTPSPDLLWPPIKRSSPGVSWAHGLSPFQPSPAQHSPPEFLILPVTDSQVPKAPGIIEPSKVLPTSSPHSQDLPIPYLSFGISIGFPPIFSPSHFPLFL